jgi:hypothetical protein
VEQTLFDDLFFAQCDLLPRDKSFESYSTILSRHCTWSKEGPRCRASQVFQSATIMRDLTSKRLEVRSRVVLMGL